MRPIATDKSNFEELRKAGQVYVDKTAHFHRLITDPSRSYFFCVRPRRFGKSLADVLRAEYIRDRLATIYAQFKDNTDKPPSRCRLRRQLSSLVRAPAAEFSF